MSPTFMGGKLSLKGDKKSKKKKKKSSAKHELDRASRREKVGAAPSSDDDELTEAERRSRKVKQRALEKDLKKATSKSHRDRVEEFSTKLGKLTELNDIPRVSAAGNG